jgi:hypothetical protein
LAAVYGKAESAKLLAAASAAFDETMKAEFQAERAYGADAVKKVYDAMVAGETDAAITYVCSMWSEAEHEPIAEATPPRAVVAAATARL